MNRPSHTRLRLRLAASRTGTAAQTPVGAERTVVTVIPERRSDTDIVFLFVGGVALAAAYRGFSNEPVLSLLFVAFSAVWLGFWIWQRLKPRFALTIGPHEIVYGRPNERQAVIAREQTGWVRIEQSSGTEPWFLIARDGDEDVQQLPLLGFNLQAVAEACEAHGWPVSMLLGRDFAAASQAAARPRPKAATAAKAMTKSHRIVVGTVIFVSFFVCLGALGVPNWYVAITSLIVMLAAIFYSHGKW